MKVNKRELAEILGVDLDTISEWQKAADFPPYERRSGRYGSIYDTTHVIRWRMGAGDDSNDRLKRLQGDKVELELARMRGDQVLTSVVAQHMASTGSSVRARILSIKSKVAPMVDADVLALIERAHIEALEEMSSDEFIERVERDSLVLQGDDTAANADGERVGGPVPQAKPRGKRRARAVAH